MNSELRFDIATRRLSYTGKQEVFMLFDSDRVMEFNHRHKDVLANYDLALEACSLITLSERTNSASNLGALRNRQLRESVTLSAALSAIAVSLRGRGSLNRLAKEQATKEVINNLKRANDRTAAQVMAEVLQTTADTLPEGEEILIESTLTEGVRNKPGNEVGGNPTISVGAVFGKREHRARYGMGTPRSVTLLSMGSDVIDGTTKSIKGLHSSFTALFVSESHVKRHLPDIYVQRWMGGVPFPEFNPRETNLVDAARIIADAYGYSDVSKLSAFFLDRPRHLPAMNILNEAAVATPYDKDGDLLPAVLLGMEGLQFPDGRGLCSMIGEIGGSAEWVVGVLPLVWRGGQAIGMLTSHSSLIRKDLSPEEMWKERFHFTEEEFMLMQDARFERKPYFTIDDILEDPFAGGISAFGAITDNFYLPFLKGVEFDREQGRIHVNVLTVSSLGTVKWWDMTFKCNHDLEHTMDLMASPKEKVAGLSGKALEQKVGEMLEQERMKERFRIFFNNEYYPALIPVHEQVVLLHKVVEGLIERGVLDRGDQEIIRVTERLAGSWFFESE